MAFVCWRHYRGAHGPTGIVEFSKTVLSFFKDSGKKTQERYFPRDWPYNLFSENFFIDRDASISSIREKQDLCH